MTNQKTKKSDKSAIILFAVNFCAVFSLIFTIGLLLLVDMSGANKKGMAATALALNGRAVDASKCAPAVFPVLFPVSSDEPVETTIEINITDEGFSPQNLDLTKASLRTIRVVNQGSADHSFVVAGAGIDSGRIGAGQSVAVDLNALPAQISDFEFYSNIGQDRDKPGLRGRIILE